MDPSAAPWRVLESTTAPPAHDDVTTADRPTSQTLQVSPLTAAAVVGAIVLAVAAFVLGSAGSGDGVVEAVGGGSLAPFRGAGPAASSLTGGGTIGSDPSIVVVEIAGAVRNPGVYRMATGSRIGDLIEAAGGYGPRVDAARASRELNLAARLADGDRVTVPGRDDVASSTTGTGGGGTAGGQSAPAVVDLNHATSAELEALPGIGPVTAGKIIASRDEQAFAAVDDLRTRKLVGAKTFEALKDLVAVR
jgi:competence protein ComEA